MLDFVRRGIAHPQKIPGYLKYHFARQLRLGLNQIPPIWTFRSYSESDYLIVEPDPAIEQPILTGDEIDEFSAEWVADPFLQYNNGTFYLFAEAAKNEYPNNGACLVWYESGNGNDWEYGGILLDKDPEDNVIDSYPQVVKSNDTRYLIPSFATKSDLDQFHIYEFTDFPKEVEHVESSISGPVRGDPTVFEWKDNWYCIFEDFDYCLRLYYSDTLIGGDWFEHESSPIEEERQLRPGGRPIVKPNWVDFFTQGPRSNRTSLLYHRITRLSPVDFEWKEVPLSPVVYPASCPGTWNEWQMHHMDVLTQSPRRGLVAVDGQNRDGNWCISLYRLSCECNYL